MWGIYPTSAPPEPEPPKKEDEISMYDYLMALAFPNIPEANKREMAIRKRRIEKIRQRSAGDE